MLQLVRKARLGAVLLGTCVLLTACSDDGDDPSGPGGSFGEATAESTAEAAMDVVDAAQPDAAFSANVTQAMTSILGLGDLAFAAPMQVVQGMVSGSSVVEGVRATSLSLAPQGPIISDELYGSTYVWDAGTFEYVVDGSATGAPANGIRVIYYAVGAGGEFATPLNPIGYIDLTDESSGATTRMGVEVVTTSGGDQTIADYYVELTAGEMNGTLDSEGYFDFEDRVDFDLHMGAEQTAMGALAQVDFLFDNDADDASLRLVMDVSENSEAGTSMSDIVFTVEDGSNVAVFEAEQVSESGSDAIDGVLRFNGQTVVEMSGAAGNPTFTGPDGAALTQRERTALVQTWGMLGYTLLLGLQVLSPFLFAVAV